MHCTNCGVELPEGVTFCTNCGTQVAAAVVTEAVAAPKKRLPLWKLIVILAAAVIVLAGLVVGGILLFGGSGAASSGMLLREKTMLRALKMADDTVAFVTMDGSVVKAGEPCDDNSYGVSLNGAAAYIISGENRALYVCNSSDKTRVGKNVRLATVSCDGKYLVYAVQDDDDGTLFRYCIATEKEKELYTVKDGSVTAFAVSPDGMSVAFTVDEDSDTEMFLSKNGKVPVSVGENKEPIAVADGAKYLYYAEHKSDSVTLYAEHNGETVRLGKCDELDGQTELNADLSELIYNLDGETYLSVRGEKGVKIADSSAYASLPANVFWMKCEAAAATPYINAYPSFIGRVFHTYRYEDGLSTTLVYVTDDGEAEELAEGLDGYRFSDDSRQLVCLKDDALTYIADVRDPDDEKLFGDAVIDGFAVTADLKHFFLLLDDGALYYAPVDGEPDKIVSDITSATVNPYAPECYVLTDDGRLYYCRAGEDREQITGIEGEIEGLNSYGTVAYFYVQNEDDSSAYDWYLLDGDKEPTLLVKGVG